MRDTAFFSRLLRLAAPWKVERVVFSPVTEQVDVSLQHRGRCRLLARSVRCRCRFMITLPSRKWRHLDHGGCVTWLQCAFATGVFASNMVCVAFSFVGASGNSLHHSFEKHAIDVLLETNIEGGARLLRISWDEAWNLMERAVERGQKAKQRRVIAHLGVDEKAWPTTSVCHFGVRPGQVHGGVHR